jgi:flagellar basal-body rod protein FlgF
MERGLYIAASGMLAELRRQDQIANDLANAATPGYKSDRSTQQSFGELLLANGKTGQAIGALGLGVQIDETTTDWAPQPLRQTDEPLDFGIQGEGYFAVRTGEGVFYTRNGQFTLSPQGILTTARGDVVLGPNGAPVQADAQGKVDPADIGVFNVAGPRKVGDNLIAGNAAGQGQHDRLVPRVRGEPEGHPHPRRDPAAGRHQGRLSPLVALASTAAQVLSAEADF